jgi:transposase-like protein
VHELDAKLAGIENSQDPIEQVARLGARLVLPQALEDEVSEFLGRGRYERSEEPVAYRNGYEPTTVKATSGAIALDSPRLRSTEGLHFDSRLLGRDLARAHALESLTICSFLRPLGARHRRRAAGGIR